MEVGHVPKIDDIPIPQSKRKVVEFNIENKMKNLWNIVDNKERSPLLVALYY